MSTGGTTAGPPQAAEARAQRRSTPEIIALIDWALGDVVVDAGLDAERRTMARDVWAAGLEAARRRAA